MAQWNKVRSFCTGYSPHGSPSGSSKNPSLEGADPELCVTLMDRGLNFNGLMNRLKSADQDWMEHFLSLGGMTAIFEALEALGSRGFSSITDAIKQLQCVACIKAVMNNQFGLEFIISQQGEGFFKKLAQGACICTCSNVRGMWPCSNCCWLQGMWCVDMTFLSMQCWTLTTAWSRYRSLSCCQDCVCILNKVTTLLWRPWLTTR